MGPDPESGTSERRRLILGQLVGHAPRVAGFDAIDVNCDLANRIPGDKQSRLLVSSVAAKLRDQLRLQSHAIPGKAGIGVDSLRGKRLRERHGLPVGIVEVGVGPVRIVASMETPCAVEGDDAADASRQGGRGGNGQWRGSCGGALRE